MSFLLLGLDSLIVCAAVGALVEPGSRLRYAALFGIADGVAFLVGAGLGWQLFSDGTSGVLTTATLVSMGIYLIVVAAGTQQLAARRVVWALPAVLVFDNLTYGLVGDHAAGTLFQQAGEQVLSSSLLALVGLLAVAAVLPRLERRAVAVRFAGSALLLAAGGFVLLG
jgi:hypothetical protein